MRLSAWTSCVGVVTSSYQTNLRKECAACMRIHSARLYFLRGSGFHTHNPNVSHVHPMPCGVAQTENGVFIIHVLWFIGKFAMPTTYLDTCGLSAGNAGARTILPNGNTPRGCPKTAGAVRSIHRRTHDVDTKRRCSGAGRCVSRPCIRCGVCVCILTHTGLKLLVYEALR